MEDADLSFLGGYSLLYENCFRSETFAAFRLCPSGSKCSASCSGGGEYFTNLAYFIDAYTEAKMDSHQYKCEVVRESCGDDDEAQCYEDAGLTDCDEENQDQNGFNLQKYLECRKVGDGVYVGPYCAEDNYNIYLGEFSDEACTYPAETSYFYEAMGYELPYSDTPIIDNECVDCGRSNGNNNDDGEAEVEVSKQCEELYEGAYSKCETNLAVDEPDTSACEYIKTLQQEEAVTIGAAFGTSTSGGSGVAIFLTILVLAGCAGGAYMYMKKKKAASEEPMLEAGYDRNMD